MGVFRNFPYSNFHEMNMDEIIKLMRELSDEWKKTSEDWESMQDFINNYFDNLDVSEEISDKIDALIASGEFNDIIDPTIAEEVKKWLDENVTPSTPLIDASLSIANACADAKATGDKIRELENNKINLPIDDETLAPTYGESGEILRTMGNGKTEWILPETPTPEQVETALAQWLEEHPEAVTTVEDNSLTEAKFTNTLKRNMCSYYNTISDMISDSTLIIGKTAHCNGYNTLNDGGGSSYYIREKTEDDVVNNESIIELANGLVAERIFNGVHTLNGGIVLFPDTDIDLLPIGDYRCATSATANTLFHAPTANAFTMKAFYINNYQNIGQIVEDIEGALFFRRGYYNAETLQYTWLEWKIIRGYFNEENEIISEILNCALTYYNNADNLYYGNNSTAVNERLTNPLGYWDGATDDVWRWTALEKRADDKLYYVFTDNQYYDTFVASSCATDTDPDTINARIEQLKLNHQNIVCQIDCNTFVFLVISGISYQNSRYDKWWRDIPNPQNNVRGYDWGFVWGDLTGYHEQVSGNRLLSNTMCHYCIDKGYAFEVEPNWNNLKAGDILFEAPAGSTFGWASITHCLIYLGRVQNGRHKIIEVRGRNEYDVTKAPVKYITINKSDYVNLFRYGARMIEPMAEPYTFRPSTTSFTTETGENYGSFDGCYYYKHNGRVHIHIGVSGLTANERQRIYTMPTGFRPYRSMCFYGTGSSIANSAKAIITNAGVIDVRSEVTYANIDLEFDAFS